MPRFARGNVVGCGVSESQTGPAPARHIAAFDGLRALAVTSVIIYHGVVCRDGAALQGAAVYTKVANMGWVGVDLFFVLSGFLITGILLDAKAKPGGHFFRTFYIRRTLRIFPLYYAVLFVLFVIGPHLWSTATPGMTRILDEQGWLWTYTSTIDVARDGGWMFSAGWLFLTHLWSLAIEEQFYLVWPLLVYVLARRGLIGVACGLVIAAPIVRVMMVHAGVSPEVIYTFTPCRIDTLAVGALLAVLVRARPDAALRVARWMIAIGAPAVLAIAGLAHGLDFDAPLVQTAGFTALAILFGGIIVGAAHSRGRATRVLAHPALALVGRYSYGMYVFHFLLMPVYFRIYDVHAVSAAIGSPVLALVGFTIVVFALTLAAATVSWVILEKPLLALKDRWAPSAGAARA